MGAKKSWNGQYTVDCSKVPDLPDFSLWFNGKAYPLKGSDYILEVQGTCISSFTGMDINLPGLIHQIVFTIYYQSSLGTVHQAVSSDYNISVVYNTSPDQLSAVNQKVLINEYNLIHDLSLCYLEIDVYVGMHLRSI